MTVRDEFSNPSQPTPEQFEQILKGNNAEDLTEAIIGLALGSTEFAVAFRFVTLPEVTAHDSAGVRGAAALSLGHLARIHRNIPEEPTCDLISAALKDPDAWVRGQAENALSDLETYAPKVAAACRARLTRQY